MENLVSRKELCNILKISISSVDRYMKQGMPFYRKGVKLVRFNVKECEDWLFKKEK